MKRIQAIALFSLAALSASTGALAQDRVLKVDVPFYFTVGNEMLPAGSYVVSSPQAGTVQIQSSDRRRIAAIVTTPGFQEAKTGSELVFHKYGQQYFLHQILCPGSSRMNVNIAPSAREKRARTLEASLDPGQQVVIAAR